MWPGSKYWWHIVPRQPRRPHSSLGESHPIKQRVSLIFSWMYWLSPSSFLAVLISHQTLVGNKVDKKFGFHSQGACSERLNYQTTVGPPLNLQPQEGYPGRQLSNRGDVGCTGSDCLKKTYPLLHMLSFCILGKWGMALGPVSSAFLLSTDKLG